MWLSVGIYHITLPHFLTEICGLVAQGSMLTGLGINTTSTLGANAISLIGLTNIGGTLLAGYLGQQYSKKYLLAGIHTDRTIITTSFILTPMTPTTVILFSIGMGNLRLATVPLTSELN